LVDVGISTLPNQFCSCRDALDLRKLLLLSKGSRGGVVPSSTAVMDMYMVGKVVGVGSYGKVRAAWHRLTGSKVAIKTYDKSKLKDPAHWKRVHSEIKIMEQVSHPRIARMYEAVETPKRMHLIMECLDGGNLCSYVKAKRRLSEEESRKIFFQILQSIEHLHMLGVTHRDIKLENILFDDKKDIKLIDFGFSTVCQPGKRLKVFCGTPSYMAPEIVRRTEYEGKPVDMWSLGILLYALLCGCFPFRAKSYPDLYRRIARGTFAIPEELSASVKDLLRQLLTVDVSQRINASAAMRHSWLQVQLATAPDINKLRLETPILISDKPSDDVDEQTLDELDKFGLGKDEVIRLVLTKTHSSIATFYYLLLDINLQKRRLIQSKRSSSSSSKTRASSSSNNYDNYTSSSKGETYLLQQTQGSSGGTLLRPKSASSGRQSSSGPQRPLSAFATRR
jgi:serine/threonine protein kinase